MPDRIAATVDGRTVALSHLDRVWWPRTGYTKGEALHYYARVASVMLPHTAGRAASFVRLPDGVEGERFYTKHLPPGAPAWVTTIDIAGKNGPRRHVDVDSLPTLMWVANLAAIEIHVPQWTGDRDSHDRLVLDLDPGPGTGMAHCCRLALLARDALAEDGLPCRAKTSGGKGLHLYSPLRVTPAARVNAYAKALARRLETAHPRLAVHRMAKELRVDRVLVDWSQNSSAKTTAAPYTLRAGAVPTVSTPLTWDEVGEGADGRELVFGPGEVIERVERDGDLLAPLLDPAEAAAIP